jgi:2-phospho-L-lactate guanylyltransferase
MILWAIIPVKPLRDGKSRLSHILTADERSLLTTHTLGHLLDILDKVPAVSRSLVVSRDTAVLKIARQHGASTFGETKKRDLNLALTSASHVATAQRADCTLILPADLPFITAEDVEMMVAGAAPELATTSGNGYFYQNRAITICPDRSNEGTNALLVCPPTGFNFQFGPNSFQRHLEEAANLAMSRRIIHAPGIKFDLDTEEDWETYLAMQPVPFTVG